MSMLIVMARAPLSEAITDRVRISRAPRFAGIFSYQYFPESHEYVPGFEGL